MAIQFKIIDHVALIMLDAQPSKNALTVSDLMHLRKTLVACQDDEQVRVIVLTGAGDRVFCCGASHKESLLPAVGHVASSMKSRETEAEEGGYTRLFDLSDLEVWKPLIAAVNGACLGGGLELALQCDLRLAAQGATFGLPEVRDATIPAAGGVQYLLRAVPSAYAMKMALTGEPISAQEALRIGLIVDLVPRDQLLSAAMSLAECIAANGPLAVQSIKRLALQTAHLTPRDFVTQAHLHWGLLRDSKDYAEGRVASVEQRAPKYTGA
ncbi:MULTISPECIES: enoyl-CoA hydratase/isomerase family protein [Pseudomonas]|jgi:E-phenylitaconyl-CoA hydratase|uniref:enoyl-CoA hydratase/isomerase family protein n=1 Tax=Pseudomonas TaxID=286 RepID=UPI00062B16AB|nr:MULTISPECIES: enoyl-CoA hydratase-related protein [Pseudomonas]KKX62282.1 enoyl-CoA hydratase [Pseudomonas putida]MCK8658354.1 enoyl-CoA hydratase-related protein [Pseudomonas umsongensis]